MRRGAGGSASTPEGQARQSLSRLTPGAFDRLSKDGDGGNAFPLDRPDSAAARGRLPWERDGRVESLAGPKPHGNAVRLASATCGARPDVVREAACVSRAPRPFS